MKIKVELTRSDILIAIACELSRRFDRDIEIEKLTLRDDGTAEIEAAWTEECRDQEPHKRKRRMREVDPEDEIREEDDRDFELEQELDEDSGDQLPGLSAGAQKLLNGDIKIQDVRGGGTRKRHRQRNMRHLGGR